MELLFHERHKSQLEIFLMVLSCFIVISDLRPLDHLNWRRSSHHSFASFFTVSPWLREQIWSSRLWTTGTVSCVGEFALWSWHPRISETCGRREDSFWECQFLFLYLSRSCPPPPPPPPPPPSPSFFLFFLPPPPPIGKIWGGRGDLFFHFWFLFFFFFGPPPPPPPSPPCFVTLLFHLHTTRAAFWCSVSSCQKAVEVSLTDTQYLFHFCCSNSQRGSGVCLFTAAVPDVFVFHVRSPFCLWSSESNLMLNTV